MRKVRTPQGTVLANGQARRLGGKVQQRGRLLGHVLGEGETVR
jgi:hypothetical protein